MPQSYSPQYREMVLAQIRAGRPVSELAAELEVSESTIFRWKYQGRIDRGESPGTTTGDNAELRAARRRVALSSRRSWRRQSGRRSCLRGAGGAPKRPLSYR